MTLSKMNKDIQDEREKVSFQIEEFTNWFHRGAEKVAEKRFLGNYVKELQRSKFTDYDLFTENFFLSDPELKDKVPQSYLSHKEKYEEAIRKSTLVFKKIRKLQEEGRDGVDIYM